MLQSIKRLAFAVALLLTASKGMAFSLLGPYDAWQNAGLGYNPLNSDIGGPKNLTEEFRWTIPVVTYGFDDNFINYFGTNGVKAVEGAFKILNDLTITPSASAINADPSKLANLPTSTMRENSTASGLNLIDLRSTALSHILEEMGLASAERYTWTLFARAVDGVPSTNYTVIQRNFDPFTYQPSSYVNDTRYTYRIVEFAPPPVAFTDAIEVLVDTTADANTSVSSSSAGLFSANLSAGIFFNGLTRDDVGGLRYLYNPNNINREDLPPGTQVVVTNKDVFQTITNIDLTLFSSQTLTSPPAALLAQYPNLIISSTNIYSSNVVTTNLVLTNLLSVTKFVNTNVLNFITNDDLAFFSSFASTSGPTALQARYPSLFIRATNTYPALDIQKVVTTTNSLGNFYTNFLGMVQLTNQDLNALYLQSRTNPPAAIQALYPGVVFNLTNSYATTVVSVATIIITNVPSPFGPPPLFKFLTNYVTNLVTIYEYSLPNVITNEYSPYNQVDVREYTLTREPFGPPNIGRTNLSTTTYYTNQPSGSFYIVDRAANPALIRYSFVDVNGNPLVSVTNVVTITNSVFPTTTFFFTNFVGGGGGFRQEVVTHFTNVTRGAYPVLFTGPGNAVLVTNYVTNLISKFTYDLPNLKILSSNSVGLVTLESQRIPGTITTATVASNFVNGTFYIVPTNLAGYSFIPGFGVTNNVRITNNIVTVVDPVTQQQYVENSMYNFASASFAVNPIEFLPNGGGALTVITNFTTNTITAYAYKFGNVLTNPAPVGIQSPRVDLRTTTFVPPNELTITDEPFVAQLPLGSILIDDGTFAFTGSQLGSVSMVTNVVFDVTNVVSGKTIRQEIVYPFTNIVYRINPVTFQSANGLALRPGVDHITFVPVVYNDVLDQLNIAFTNTFTGTVITNSKAYTQTYRRIINRPDILFSAGDLGTLSDNVTPVLSSRTLATGWINNAAANGGAAYGPGTIVPGITITFNKLGPSSENFFPGFGNANGFPTEADAIQYYFWGSFDGTTAPPIVYPQDLSLQDLENFVLKR